MKHPAGRPVIGFSLGFHDFDDYAGVGVQPPVSLAGGVPLVFSRIDVDAQLDLCEGVVLAPGGTSSRPARAGTLRGPRSDGSRTRRIRARRAGSPRARAGPSRPRHLPRQPDPERRARRPSSRDLRLRSEWADHPSDRSWLEWKRVEEASIRDGPLPSHPRHRVAIERESRLARALGAERARWTASPPGDRPSRPRPARCRARPGRRRRSGRARGDGVFGLGVQWELHESRRVDRRFLRVFEAFVAAASGKPSAAPAGVET